MKLKTMDRKGEREWIKTGTAGASRKEPKKFHSIDIGREGWTRKGTS
jgi:hypothetical protein